MTPIFSPASLIILQKGPVPISQGGQEQESFSQPWYGTYDGCHYYGRARSRQPPHSETEGSLLLDALTRERRAKAALRNAMQIEGCTEDDINDVI